MAAPTGAAWPDGIGMLFIIFGTRGVTYTVDKGTFACPDCAAERDYRKRRVRRFFTLYFIPIIPLNLAGEYVECRSCKSTYQPEVVDYDPAEATRAFEAGYRRAIKRVMIGMMAADGNVAEEEVRTIRDIYGQLTGRSLEESEIRAAARDVGVGDGLESDLRDLGPMLNDQGKEMVIQAAFMVAASDGEIHDSERELIVRLGTALGMSEAHMKGALESAAA